MKQTKTKTKAQAQTKAQTETQYEKTYNILQNIGYYFTLYRRTVPIFLWLCLAEILFGAIQPLFGIYLPKLAVDLVTEGVTWQRLLLTFGVFGLLYLSVQVAVSACGEGKYFLYNTRRNLLLSNLFLKSLRVPYRYVEEGTAKELYWKALGVVDRGDWSAVCKMTYGTIDIIKNIISFALYGTVLSFLSPWMAALLFTLSLIQYVISLSKIKYMEKFREEDADLAKKRNYVFNNAIGNRNAAKDVRIFGMKGWLNREKDMLLDRSKRLEKRKGTAEYRYWQMGSLLTLARDIFAYAYLLKQVFEGSVGPGDFVLYFGAITGFSGFLGSIMDGLAQLRSGSRDTCFYRAYMDLPEEELHTGSRHISELKQPVSIEFKDVSFSYDGGENKIFNHFNLKINAGEKLALVGVNGAGKSTLVKLLCGMYDPDEGTILIGGVDRNEFPRAELFQLFSAVFQEAFLLPVTVAENLTFESAYDEKRAWRALEDAGLSEKFREKGFTMDTFFDKDMDENGVELSGGETQRFLLARALYKDAPVLVLDEPTAALDPIAESEIYDNYARYSGGKTALFISHRLASTRFSDRIVLLGEGGILEEGSHQELMDRKGAYAEMFEVQSRYYAKDRLEKEVF
ncbi:MAG: ABC transporter ATP-binding protein/permease [Butyrivibrio sp.]|nr:ABC transporter ATP-binding protein/permease [Acetatifactor muris]MCM1558429.1 ABC transporter ATP-binding protein/permease [Butyrivibrio sp.]